MDILFIEFVPTMDSILLFDFVPKELLLKIFEYSAPQVIAHCAELSPVFEEMNILSYMRKRAYNHTKLKTDNADLEQLVRICKLPRFNKVYAGAYSSYIIDNQGDVYVCGEDLRLDNKYTPTHISGFKNIVQITEGLGYVLGLTETGHVYFYGDYDKEILPLGIGFGSEDKILFNLTIIPELNNIIQIASGYLYSIALTSDGQVYFFRCCNHKSSIAGDLSKPIIIPNINNICSVAIGANEIFMLTDNGEVYELDPTNNNIFKHDNENIVQISGCCLSDPVLLTSNGNAIFSCEIASHFVNASDLIYISHNTNHSLGITKDGKVYSGGIGKYGGTGLNIKSTERVEILEGPFPLYTMVYDEISGIIPSLNNVISVSAGVKHSIVSTSDNTIYVFGNNDEGQLGLPDIEGSNVPVLLSF